MIKSNSNKCFFWIDRYYLFLLNFTSHSNDEHVSYLLFVQTDFDSIDRIDDLDGQPKLQHHNGIKPKSKCKKTSKEDKAVKCLYYTMMCCECTIS